MAYPGAMPMDAWREGDTFVVEFDLAVRKTLNGPRFKATMASTRAGPARDPLAPG